MVKRLRTIVTTSCSGVSVPLSSLLMAGLLLAAPVGCGKDQVKKSDSAGETDLDEATPVATKPADGAAKPDDGAAKPADDSDQPAATLYYDRKLTAEELRTRSLRELSLMRNTIFARGGNKFRKKWLSDYFSAQPWYKPSDKLDKSKISKADWDNVRLIAEVERSFTKDELNARKTNLLTAIGDGEPNVEQSIELALLSRRAGKWLGKKTKTKLSPLEDPSRLDEILTVEELQDMSRKDLRLVRNTIYARHGYEFKSPILEDYFMFMDWYKPDPKFTEKMLSKVDWKNIKLVKSIEDELGGPMRDNEHGEEIGWFDGA